MRGHLCGTAQGEAELQKVFQVSSYEAARRQDKILQCRGMNNFKVTFNVCALIALKTPELSINHLLSVRRDIPRGAGAERDERQLEPGEGPPRTIATLWGDIAE